jgi:hypothetical protein
MFGKSSTVASIVLAEHMGCISNQMKQLTMISLYSTEIKVKFRSCQNMNVKHARISSSQVH